MMSPKPVAFELDGKTHAALELLAGEAGCSPAAMASKIVSQGIWHRINTHRAGLLDAIQGPSTAERKARIAAQAQALDHKYNGKPHA